MAARKRAYGGDPACPGSAPSRGRADLVASFAPARLVRGASLVLRLAMVLPFMHLQPCGGPRGRRKRFRRSVAQWLEHRSPNSALAIPPRFIECHLVNVFGPKMPASARHYASPSYRVPPNSFAKMLAAVTAKPQQRSWQIRPAAKYPRGGSMQHERRYWCREKRTSGPLIDSEGLPSCELSGGCPFGPNREP